MNIILKKISLISLSTALLLSIAGCSDSGSSSDNPPSATAVTYGGTAIDGILVGSTVCIDVNANNICDAGEPSAITDSSGNFTIPATTATGPLLVVGGVDNSTGASFTGLLKAPKAPGAGLIVITPLTSAIQSLVESGKSAADAEENIKAAMGLTDVNLTTFNPYAEITGANALKAQAVLARQTQLQVLVHSATVTVAGADAGTDVNSTMSFVFDEIVKNFSGATAPVALDAAKVTAATKAAADKVYVTKPAARVAAKVVAQTSAENSVRDADSANNAISSGTPAEATGNLDAAIIKVNTSAEIELRAAAAAAKVNADALEAANAGALAAIEVLQKDQQEKEAAILAAQEAQAAAEAALATAKAAAEADALDRVKYEAYLAAQATAAKSAAEKAAADEAAALAAKLAAAQEKLISAEAALREAAAEAAEAQALAERLEAEAIQAAAEKAAADAAVAVNLAAAQQAATDALVAAADGIAQAKVNTYAQMAAFFANRALADANTTQVIAELNITGTLVDGNATLARTAALAAQTAALSAITLVDINSTDVNASIAYKVTAGEQAVIVAAALENARTIKADAELQAAIKIVTDAKIARISTIVNAVNAIDANVTAQLATASTKPAEVEADMNAIFTIASQYSAAQTKAYDANVSANAAATAYSEALTASADINTSKVSVLAAQTALDETAAQTAQANAEASKVTLISKLELLYTKADEVAAYLVEVQAIKAAEIGSTAVASGDVWSENMNIFSFWIENYNGPEVVYSDIRLSSGAIINSEYAYDMNITWNNGPAKGDITLNTSTGDWNTSTVETYIIDSTDSSLLTLNGSKIIRLDSVTVLDGQILDLNDSGNTLSIPVTYTPGSLQYNLSEKTLVDTYTIDWEPTVWDQIYGDTGLGFTSIKAFMDAAGSFYWDETTRTSIQAEMDSSTMTLAVDSNGSYVGTLDNNETGNLVIATYDTNITVQTVVGTWRVTNLPGQTALSVVAELNTSIPNYDAYMQYGQMSATLYDADGNGTATVHMVRFKPAMTVFAPQTDDILVNATARDNIKTAVESFVFPVTIDVRAYFLEGTKYFFDENGLKGERTAIGGGTYTGVITAFGADLNVTGYWMDQNNAVSFQRDTGLLSEYTYIGLAPVGTNGEAFTVVTDGNSSTAVTTYTYDTAAERDAAMVP